MVEACCRNGLVVGASDQLAALYFHHDLSIRAELVEAIPFLLGLLSVLFGRQVDEALHFVAEESGGQLAKGVLNFQVELRALHGLDVFLAAAAIRENAAVFPSLPAADRAGVVKLAFGDASDGAAEYSITFTLFLSRRCRPPSSLRG